MKERSFDEMVAYFNRRVSEMDIAQDYKMELLGMVTALGYKHEKTAAHWIPCSIKPPEDGWYLVTTKTRRVKMSYFKHGPNRDSWVMGATKPIAWMELPEGYRG